MKKHEINLFLGVIYARMCSFCKMGLSLEPQGVEAIFDVEACEIYLMISVCIYEDNLWRLYKYESRSQRDCR
jgi:hypothetical protein